MWWVEPRACRCDHSLLATESQSITSPRLWNLKRAFSYLSVNILDYVGINPERNVLKEDKVARSRRVCWYLTLFNRSGAKWRRNSCRGSFFPLPVVRGFSHSHWRVTLHTHTPTLTTHCTLRSTHTTCCCCYSVLVFFIRWYFWG